MLIDRNTENLVHETYISRVGLLQLFCLEKLDKKEAAKEDKDIDTLNGKKLLVIINQNIFKNRI